jgi:hypothetical protein
MKNLSIALSAVFATALPAGAQSTQPDLPPVVVEAAPRDEYEIRSAARYRVVEARFRESPAAVWAVLPEVLREMGIEPQADPARERTVGNPQITGNRVAGERTSRYMTCDQTGAGPGAVGQLRIRMQLVVQVRPEADGARTFTRLVGTATPMEGSRAQPVSCDTTGRLEQKIEQGVAARLRAASSAAPGSR